MDTAPDPLPAGAAAPDEAPAFDYQGPPELYPLLLKTLHRVVDPEMALTIVDVGLVYAVAVQPDAVRVTVTMTSAACPVTDLILDDIDLELSKVLPPGQAVDLDLVWEPPWTPDRMSPRAKSFMGW